jgi:hypothetical protein
VRELINHSIDKSSTVRLQKCSSFNSIQFSVN